MRKIISLTISLLLLAAVFLTSGCNGGEASGEEFVYELLPDKYFERGFDCSAPTHAVGDAYPFNKKLNNNPALGAPLWSIAQNGCKYGFADGYEVKDGKKYTVTDRLIKNERGETDVAESLAKSSKILYADGETGTFTLEANASNQYTDGPRVEGEAWLHLLLTTGFDKQPVLSGLNKYVLSMDITLKKFVDHMGGKADTGLHASQFQMFFVMKSNATSEFVWFGVPLFDNRSTSVSDMETGMPDAGTGMYIYGVPTAEYMDHTLELNETAHIEIDLLSYLQRALKLANSKGYMINISPSDLYFSDFNYGWEVPGTYDVSIETKNFSVKAYSKTELK